MNHTEGTFKGIRNANIFYQAWLPDGKVRAVLLLVHGAAEHTGRYMNIVNHFVPLGYAVYGLDHFGHGRSDGQRVYVERFDDYIEPLKTFYTMVKGWQPDKPIFILGHSLGGLIESYYLLDHQKDFTGAVISAPYIKIPDTISPLTITIGKLLSKISPRAGLLALDANAVSKDPTVVKAYVTDPLVYTGKITARLAAEMLRAVKRVTDEAGTISLPMIILQGKADKLVDPAGAQMLYDKSSSMDKTLKMYDGLYHEVFNEPEREQVLSDVEVWLESHLK
ncbi:MAG TPA: lysophospholipase [Anaerolineales bacterium]